MVIGIDPNETQKDLVGGERYLEAYRWVMEGAELNPGILFQAIVGGQLITAEVVPQSIRELWCDECPPVWELERHV